VPVADDRDELFDATDRGWVPPSVDRPVATFMVVAAVAVFGWVSLNQLPVELMPELSHPTLTVRTVYPGAAPEEVEDAITRPIEGYLGTVEGLIGMRSVSRAGSSDVMFRFEWGADLDAATQKIRERLALLDPPDGAEPYLVLRYDPTLDPVLEIAVSSEAVSPSDLRTYVEEEVERELEELPGVAMVRVSGGDEPIVRVALDEGRLASLGVAPSDVVARLQAENVNVAGGRLLEGEIEYLVRTVNALTTITDVGAIVVAAPGGVPIRLRDVATVREDVRERTVLNRVDGRESVELRVYKDADANLVAMAAAVRERVFGSETASTGDDAEEARGVAVRSSRDTPPLSRSAPEGVTFELLTDQSRYVDAAIDEVTETAMFGGIVAVLVLFVFLRRGYATAVIGLAIPLSVIATFAPMRMLGVSINIMSLGGIALGVGMLVDNAIVVLESIVRCREEGDAPREAALRGTREVAGAVTASTLTTVAVFFPIVFVEGIAGQLFGDLGLAVVLSLCASLLFALFFVPMMAVLPARLDGPSAPGAEVLRSLVRSSAVEAARRDGAWVTGRLRGGGVGRVLAVLVAAWVLVRTAIWGAIEVVARLAGAVIVTVVIALSAVAGAVARFAGWLLSFPLGAFERGFAGLTLAYRAVLRRALRGRIVVFALAAGALWWAGSQWGALGVQLMPELSQGVFSAELTLPVGTRLDETSALARRVEQALVGHPDVERVATLVGRDEDDLDASDQGDHTAELTVVVGASDNVEAAEARALASVREALALEPAVRLEITRPELLSLEAPIVVEVRGQDLDALEEAAAVVERRMRNVPELQDVRSSAREGFPEVRIRFDRDRLAALGLDIREAAETVRAKVQGEVATSLRDGDRTVDVDVALSRAALRDLDDLRAMTVAFVDMGATGGGVFADADAQSTLPGGMGGALTGSAALDPLTAGGATEPRAIPLSAVAEIEIGRGPAEIRHVDGQRAAVVTASSTVVDLGGVVRALEEELDGIPLADDQLVVISGQSEEMEAAQASLLFALALAVFLVYVVMASNFESLLGPFVILGTIPLAAVGVVAVLTWLDAPISVVALIGVIVLAGIVVNNAIVLIDYVLMLERRGLARTEAVVEACALRLRPVAITTTTTVLGLLPMALDLGEGAEIRRPLAWVIIAGLSAGTLLTLMVIPVAYDTLASAVARLRRRSRAPIAD
jgi:HAE1 family hydrophobic/amphiphilic exporter-1